MTKRELIDLLEPFEDTDKVFIESIDGYQDVESVTKEDIRVTEHTFIIPHLGFATGNVKYARIKKPAIVISSY